jgi:hypothetical protein
MARYLNALQSSISAGLREMAHCDIAAAQFFSFSAFQVDSLRDCYLVPVKAARLYIY